MRSREDRSHLFWLLVWIAIGTGLRLANLTLKPLWTDEASTLVFSLGHSYRTIPLNQVLSIAAVLQPLEWESQTGVGAVVEHLTTESNHPFLYFVLTHVWLKLFPIQQGETLVWAARSLSALFGVLAIPAMFGLGWLAFRSRLVAQLAAALMAVSPFGIYLAQEARHYTLAVLWEIGSLACLVVAMRCLAERQPLPRWLMGIWIAVNGLGIATHYFFTFSLAAAALVLGWQGIRQTQKQRDSLLQPYWRQIYGVAAGTLILGLAWIPLWNNTYGSELTEWLIHRRTGLEWLDPLLPSPAWILTMVTLLPIDLPLLPLRIAAGLILILFVIGVIPVVIRGLKAQKTRSLEIWTLGGFVLASLGVLLALSYGLHLDLTSVPRYSFVYFPGVILVLAAALAYWWRQSGRGRAIVRGIWVMGLLGALVVNWDLGYQKSHQPDRLAQPIQTLSQGPALIAIVYETHAQTGRLISLAWEISHDCHQSEQPPQFLLAHQGPRAQPPIPVVQTALTQLPRPLDLWLIDFPPIALEGCAASPEAAGKGDIYGYRYQLYRCR